MPVASDTARAISILASLLWAAGVAGARQCRLELGLDHRLDELTHPITQADFNRIKPIVEKRDLRLGLRLQGCRVRAIAGHGVSPPALKRRDYLGFSTRRLRHLQFQPHPGRHLSSTSSLVTLIVPATLFPVEE